jgi:4-amino-4-deoxy-L-arabinose transferase-like glycosyltransferase
MLQIVALRSGGMAGCVPMLSRQTALPQSEFTAARGGEYVDRDRLARLTTLRILAIALLTRVAWIAFCANEPVSDQKTYHASAAFIAAGLGYVDQSGNAANYYPVGYSALLAPFYFAFGSTYRCAFAVNAALGLLTVWGVHALAHELFGGRVARWAALAAALYPTFVMYTTCIASENAYIPAILWTLWLGHRAARAGRAWPLCIVTGAVLAAAVLIRSTIVLLLPVLLLVFLLVRRELIGSLLRIALVTATAAVLLLPWCWRNQREFGSFTPLSMNGGVNLWMGNHQGGDGDYAAPPDTLMALPTLQRDRELSRRAVAFVREHPGRYLQLCVRRIFQTMRSDTSAVRWNVVGLQKHFGEPVVFALKIATCLIHFALIGLVMARAAQQTWRRRWSRSDLIVAATAAAASVPFVFIVSSDRYHLPMTGFLLIWAAALLVRDPAATSSPSPGPRAQATASSEGGQGEHNCNPRSLLCDRSPEVTPFVDEAEESPFS